MQMTTLWASLVIPVALLLLWSSLSLTPSPVFLPPSPSYSFFTFNSSSSSTTFLPSSSSHTLLLLWFLLSFFMVQHISHSVSVPLIRQTPGLGAIPPSCLLAKTSLAHRLQHRCFYWEIEIFSHLLWRLFSQRLSQLGRFHKSSHKFIIKFSVF